MSSTHTTEPAGSLHWKAATIAVSVVLLALAALQLLPASAAAGRANCTAEAGQAFIDAGRYSHAVREFGCVIAAAPTEVEGYRGRAEALLLLGRYSDAMTDYGSITAYVVPVHPDAMSTIHAGYDARLAARPNDVPALTGASFARWKNFQYARAIQHLQRLLEVAPNDVYATLYRGSASLLLGATKERGIADLERALALAPTSADVRFIVADAYTYGLFDPVRALAEANRALAWGLDTPRVHAILGSVHNALGNQATGAAHVRRHIQLVTTDLRQGPTLSGRGAATVDLVPGRTYELALPATAGQTISIVTGSRDFYDSIAVLLAPDGTPVLGSDDDRRYFAAFAYTAQVTGTYRLRVTSFEAIDTGRLDVSRG